MIGSEHTHKATELQYDYKKRKNKTRNKYLDRELRSHTFKQWKRTPISVCNYLHKVTFPVKLYDLRVFIYQILI